MLYLTHSSYTLIGIMHYSALRLLRIPLDPLLDEARRAVKDQLLGGPSLAVDRQPFPTREAARRLLSLTVLIALPAGIWYSSISLTSMTSLTALYNLNAWVRPHSKHCKQKADMGARSLTLRHAPSASGRTSSRYTMPDPSAGSSARPSLSGLPAWASSS